MAPVKRKEKPEEVAAKVATKAARELVRGISGIVPVIPLAALEKANHEVRRASRDIRKHAKDLNGSMLSGSIVDEGVVKRVFTPEEHKRYGPEIGEINRLVSEIGRARKEGDMETADRHAKELRSNIEALATKEHMRKKTVSQLIDQKATELTGSKNIRPQWFGTMAHLLIKEGNRKAAPLAVSMGILEDIAGVTAPKEGARKYLPSYQLIHDTIAEKKPLTPDKLEQFTKQIEAAAITAETKIETTKFRNAIRRWGTRMASQKRVVKAALDKVDDLAGKGKVEEAYKLLMLTATYVNSGGMLGKRVKGMITSLGKEDAKLLHGMERALEALAKGKEKVGEEAAEKVFMESYNLAQSTYATRKLKSFEKVVGKVRVGRETINAAIIEAKERITAGDPTRALLLLEYMGHYLRKYNLITGKKAERVPDYAKGREEMLEGMGGEIKARSDAERAAAGQLFDRGTFRITGAKGLRDDFKDLQRKLKGEVPFVKGLPETKGKVPLGEIEKGKYQSYLSIYAIRLHDREVPGTTLKGYVELLERAASRGDARAYTRVKKAFMNRILLVAGSKLKRRALTKAGVPLTTNIEPMLKGLEEMYKAQPLKGLEKLYKRAYPPTRDEGRYYMDVRKKFLLRAALFYRGRKGGEVLPEIKPALKRVADLEKRRAALVKELRSAMKTEKKIPRGLMQEYRRFLTDINIERKKAAALDAFVKQLELNEDYHSMTGEVLGSIAGVARSQLRTSRKLLEEGCVAAIRGDFKTAEAKYKAAIHKRRIALGMYSGEALKLKWGKEKLAPKYAGAPQFAFYEDIHTNIFHGTLHGFKSETEQKAAENLIKAATRLELAYFMIPADAMSQFFSDFSDRQENVRTTVKEAAESFQAGNTTEGNKKLKYATQVWEDMQASAERNRRISNVAVIAGGIAGGHIFGWVLSGAVFTTSALDAVVTEYSVKGYASPQAWGGLAAMVAMMGLSGAAHMLRSAAEYKVGLGATRYASRLTAAAKTVEYTNMALGVGFVGYMSYEATTAFMEGRIADGLLTAGMAFYPVLHMKMAPRWETYKTRRTAKTRAATELRMILDDMTTLRPAAPRGLPRGTWDAVELLNPRSMASLRNTLEGLTISEKAVTGKTPAAREAITRRSAARETLERIRVEQPEVATVVDGMLKNPAIMEYIGTGRATTASQTAWKWAESKMKRALPEALEATRAEALRAKIAVGAEGTVPVTPPREAVTEPAKVKAREAPPEVAAPREAKTVPSSVLDSVRKGGSLSKALEALAETNPSKARLLERTFDSLMREGHYAERFRMASAEERAMVLEAMAEGHRATEAFDIMVQRMAPTTGNEVAAFAESMRSKLRAGELTYDEVSLRLRAITGQERRLGNLLDLLVAETTPREMVEGLIKDWGEVQGEIKRVDALIRAREARSPEQIKTDEIKLINDVAKAKGLNAIELVRAYGEGRTRGRLDVLESLKIEAFRAEQGRATTPEKMEALDSRTSEFFDLVLKGNLESHISTTIPGFKGTTITEVGYIGGMRGVNSVKMSNGKTIFVKMESAGASIFGRSLVMAEGRGLFTSDMYGAKYDTGLKIRVEGKEETVMQEFTLIKDVREYAGTRQTIRLPTGELMENRTLLGVELVGGRVETAILSNPTATNPMHEIFYALSSTQKGRQLVFRAWRAYHEMSRRALLIDRFLRNSAFVVSGKEGVVLTDLLKVVREKGPNELVNMIEKGTVDVTFQPIDVDYIAGRVKPTAEGGFNLKDFNGDFAEATNQFIDRMPYVLRRASTLETPSGKKLFEGEVVPSKRDIAGEALGPAAEKGAELPLDAMETKTATESIIRRQDGKPSGAGFDTADPRSKEKVGDIIFYGKPAIIADRHGRYRFDSGVVTRILKGVLTENAQRTFIHSQRDAIIGKFRPESTTDVTRPAARVPRQP